MIPERTDSYRLTVAAAMALLLSACAGHGLEPDLEAASGTPASQRQADASSAASAAAPSVAPAPARAEAPDSGGGPLESLLHPEREKQRRMIAQNKLGEKLAREMLAKVKLADDAATGKRLEKIVERLARANPQSGHDKWRVHLIADPRANAFTTGAGHLFITTGMVELLGDDEKIATVLAHEMAHNALGHVIEAQEKKAMARDAHRFSREVLAGKMSMEWLSKSLSFLVNTSLNTYSRQQEDEADAEGLDYLVRAGWPPQAVLRTFDKLAKYYREDPGVKNFFYGNHPTYKSRRWHMANTIRAHYRNQAGLPPVRTRNYQPKNGQPRPDNKNTATAAPAMTLY